MKLLLKDDVKNLGKIGDVVSVRDGYGRNFLLPRGLATAINAGNLRALEKIKKIRMVEDAARVEQLRRIADEIAILSITTDALVSEGDNLYGAISTRDLANKINEHGFNLDADVIQPAAPLKTLGEHRVPIKLHHDVKTEIKVVIIAKNAE